MRRLLTVVLVVLAALAVVTPFATAAPSPTPDPALARLASLSGKAFDAAFIAAVVPMHEESVEIALTATLNADHSELLRWNQKMVERKNAQVRQMLAWAQEDRTAPRRMVGIATDPVKRMRGLRGAALEKAYLPLMGSRLERTATLARLAASKGSRPELRALGQQIARTDGDEARMLRVWLRTWYP